MHEFLAPWPAALARRCVAIALLVGSTWAAHGVALAAQAAQPATEMPRITKPKQFHYDATTDALFEKGLAAYDRKNYAAALPHIQQAADRGHARAQSLLGIMYRAGRGVGKDLRKAAYWFEKAAAQEHRAAAFHLGNMYDVGDGVAVDKALAVKYYDISARQGYHEAQFELAFNHEFGQGTPRNRKMAIFWLTQAQRQGDGLAGWTASFLKDPRTPHFQNAQQLRNYIDQKVAAWVARITPQGGGGSSSSGSGGGSPSGGSCGSYTNHAACNAYKAGEGWAAERLQRGDAPPSERAWYGR